MQRLQLPSNDLYQTIDRYINRQELSKEDLMLAGQLISTLTERVSVIDIQLKEKITQFNQNGDPNIAKQLITRLIQKANLTDAGLYYAIEKFKNGLLDDDSDEILKIIVELGERLDNSESDLHARVTLFPEIKSSVHGGGIHQLVADLIAKVNLPDTFLYSQVKRNRDKMFDFDSAMGGELVNTLFEKYKFVIAELKQRIEKFEADEFNDNPDAINELIEDLKEIDLDERIQQYCNGALKDNPVAIDQLISDLRTCRDAGAQLNAEMIYLNAIAHYQPATKALGWPKTMYMLGGKGRKLQPNPNIKILQPKPPRLRMELQSKPNFDMYAVLKCRGIHYRQEPGARFSDFAIKQAHIASSQVNEATYSDAVYRQQRRNSRGEGDVDSRGRPIRNRADLMIAGESIPGAIIELSEDVVDDHVYRTARDEISEYDSSIRCRPLGQTLQREADRQYYINAMERYKQHLASRGDTIGITEISTTDSPEHAALYGLGEKFTTKNQLSLAAKRIEQAKTYPERCVEGYVGKLYLYFFSPAELHPNQPTQVAEQEYNPTQYGPHASMIDRREKRIALKPNQARELETTFYGHIPQGNIVGEMDLVIPVDRQAEYQHCSDLPDGSKLRRKFAADFARQAWQEAYAQAAKRGKILIPHGTLYALFKDEMPDLVAQASATQPYSCAELIARHQGLFSINAGTMAQSTGNAAAAAAAEEGGYDVGFEVGLAATHNQRPKDGDGDTIMDEEELGGGPQRSL
jgi:hypothetical protein